MNDEDWKPITETSPGMRITTYTAKGVQHMRTGDQAISPPDAAIVNGEIFQAMDPHSGLERLIPGDRVRWTRPSVETECARYRKICKLLTNGYRLEGNPDSGPPLTIAHPELGIVAAGPWALVDEVLNLALDAHRINLEADLQALETEPETIT